MLLDTDVLIDLIRGDRPALNWFAALTHHPTVSGIAALELAWGAQDAAELRKVQRFLRPFPILWPTEEDMRYCLKEYASLHLSHGLDIMDAITAALAVRHSLEVATFNVKHLRNPRPGHHSALYPLMSTVPL